MTLDQRALQKTSALLDNVISFQSESFILRQSMIIIFLKISASSIDLFLRRSKRLMKE